MEKLKGKDVLINRTQMLEIAKKHNIIVSQGTIHRWANEPDFPQLVGKEGKYLLYFQRDFVRFLNRRLRNIQERH
jgi:hypothetical protein